MRARPVNRRVLEQTVGVPAKQARPATTVEPFQLTQTAPKPAVSLSQLTMLRSLLAVSSPLSPRWMVRGISGMLL